MGTQGLEGKALVRTALLLLWGHGFAKIQLPVWVGLGINVDNRLTDMQLTSLACY
jgi:hypothetical protein